MAGLLPRDQYLAKRGHRPAEADSVEAEALHVHPSPLNQIPPW
jgi:hypothetical protein